MAGSYIKTYGNSMFPFFVDGDVLNIIKVSFRKIQVDDFITFKLKGRYITHRVVYKNPKGTFLITKGDHNPQPDGKVLASQILGKVISIKRKNQLFHTTDLYFFQSTLYFKEITKVKDALFDNHIDFLILKGLPLHLYFEKKFPSRLYADCDILIDKKQQVRVEQIFKRLNYQKIDEALDPHIKKLKDKEIEIQYKKTINGILVAFDIHLEAVFLMTQLGSLEALYPQTLLDSFSALLLSNKRRIKLNNEYFPILTTELLIIYLALHLFHHNYQGYYRYLLIQKILELSKINYKKIAEIINFYKLKNFTSPVFIILKKHYSSSFPPSLFQSKPKVNIVKHLNKNILNLNILSDETRVTSGIKRFRNIFILSSEPLLKKLLVIFNLQVLYAVYFTIIKKASLSYFRYNLLLKQKFNLTKPTTLK